MGMIFDPAVPPVKHGGHASRTCYTECVNSYCGCALAVNSKGVVRWGETIVRSNDKKNKGSREDRKKAKLNPKEKRKLKNETKKKFNPFGTT